MGLIEPLFVRFLFFFSLSVTQLHPLFVPFATIGCHTSLALIDRAPAVAHLDTVQ
jgi:hypothetical protein